MTGRLVAVVGPSGAGKDSVIAGLLAARPDWRLGRRAITRPASDTEPFEPVTEAEFAARREAGAFALHWEAHGLLYGLSFEALDDVRAGRTVLANLSRAQLAHAAAVFPALAILEVAASPETLAARLKGRDRESAEDIARRLARPAPPMPPGVPHHRIENEGTVQEAVAKALSALAPQGAS